MRRTLSVVAKQPAATRPALWWGPDRREDIYLRAPLAGPFGAKQPLPGFSVGGHFTGLLLLRSRLVVAKQPAASQRPDPTGNFIWSVGGHFTGAYILLAGRSLRSRVFHTRQSYFFNRKMFSTGLSFKLAPSPSEAIKMFPV
jgi:hypothetical protein